MAELEGHSFWLCDYPDRDYLKHTLLPIEELPLSFELNNQITEWVKFYDYYFAEIVLLSKAKELVYKDNFDMLGRQLWQLVKEELAGKYKVLYYSELEQKVLQD